MADGKAIQRDLFQKKLWFHAFKSRVESQYAEDSARSSVKCSEVASGHSRWQESTDVARPYRNDPLESLRLSFDMPSSGLRPSAAEIALAADEFSRSGVIMLRRDPGDFSASEKCADAAAFVFSRLAVLREAATAAGVGAEDCRLKTAEMVRRSPGRYDVIVDPSGATGAALLVLREAAPWLPLVSKGQGQLRYPWRCQLESLPGIVRGRAASFFCLCGLMVTLGLGRCGASSGRTRGSSTAAPWPLSLAPPHRQRLL